MEAYFFIIRNRPTVFFKLEFVRYSQLFHGIEKSIDLRDILPIIPDKGFSSCINCLLRFVL